MARAIAAVALVLAAVACGVFGAAFLSLEWGLVSFGLGAGCVSAAMWMVVGARTGAAMGIVFGLALMAAMVFGAV